MGKKFVISGKIVDLVSRRIYNGDIRVEDGVIAEIKESNIEYSHYIMPGFVDSHVHIESSMLIPSGFARAAVKSGTVASVSDPHEIANVLGLKGLDFMIQNGKKTPFKFYFGAPSCVPATPFETSGAVIDSEDIMQLMKRKDIYYLAEMMNFPGVLFKDDEVVNKIKHARAESKPVDGHAPGLNLEDIAKYASAGITTDHECTNIEEARRKIENGIKIQIREGSAAKNFEALYPLINDFPDKVMFCTDDFHPDDLIKGHINQIVKRAILKGVDFYDALIAATKTPKEHYNLNIGLLQEKDPADFIVLRNIDDFEIEKTFINGELVYCEGEVLMDKITEGSINNFNCNKISIKDIEVSDKGKKIQVIVAKDGDLYTGKEVIQPKITEGSIVSDTERDLLKIVIVNRYHDSEPQIGFIKNFNLKIGAIAGSIAHDSHNIVAIGTNDEDIVMAINRIIENKGGIIACNGDSFKELKLNVAGLMSTEEAEEIAKKYEEVNNLAKEFGSKLRAPFMTMAFMALLVIPELKIGDKGLFDVTKFDFTSLFVE